jgi:hypothetical protein
MTAQTATYAITYATSTDVLCDAPTITEQMAEDIEAALSGIAADIDRLTVVPYVVVAAAVTIPALVYDGGAVNEIFEMPWDSVLADTDNFADFPIGGNPTMDWSADQNPTGVYLAGTGFANYTSSGNTFANYETKDLDTVTLSPIALNIQAAPTTYPGNVNEQGLMAMGPTHANSQITCEVVANFAGGATDNITGTITGTYGYFVWMRDFS